MRDDPIGPLYDTAPARPKAPFPAVSVAVKAVRAKLAPVRAPEPVWPLVGAAALCAGSALVLAAVVILGPPMAGPDVTAGPPAADVKAPPR